MFSNDLIRSLVKSSDEKHLKLSKDDWYIVLEANKGFSQRTALWRGNDSWGRFLVSKVGGKAANLDFRDSLELCSGNGFLFFSFMNLFDFTNTSHFIDLSATQCAAFENRCKLSGVNTPNILCGDIGNLPFKDGSLGMVYGHSFLHHLPDVGLYLKEACRVLRKGGRFVAFHEPTATAPFLESFPRSLIKRIDDGSLTDIWLIQPEIIKNLLLDTGYSKVEVFLGGLTASFMVTPWQLILDKFGLPYQFSSLPNVLATLHKLDSLLPSSIMYKFAPSLAIIASK